jgi:hypothetical protein
VAHGVLVIEHLRAVDAQRTIHQWMPLPDIRSLLHPSDRMDEFIEMARLDARAMTHPINSSRDR